MTKSLITFNMACETCVPGLLLHGVLNEHKRATSATADRSVKIYLKCD
jgi:hypothetical protein